MLLVVDVSLFYSNLLPEVFDPGRQTKHQYLRPTSTPTESLRTRNELLFIFFNANLFFVVFLAVVEQTMELPPVGPV